MRAVTEVRVVTTERYGFAFDRRFVPMLAAIGVRPSNSEVVLDDDTFRASFGRLRVVTPVANLEDVRITGDYRWYRAIGARWSFTDHGATFGTNTRAGVCVCFHEPVPALFGRRFRHPGLTVTVDDPEGLADAIRRRIG